MNGNAGSRFSAALRYGLIKDKIHDELADAMIELVKEIAQKPIEQHTEKEKRFVSAFAKLHVIARVEGVIGE